MTKLLWATALATLAVPAFAQDAVTLQLKWVTQAQFAGYYAAEAQGFYDEENLDVTILPGGPDIAPTQVIAGGGADVVVDWMPSALAVFMRWPRKRWSVVRMTCFSMSASGLPARLSAAAVVLPRTFNHGSIVSAWITPGAVSSTLARSMMF